MRYGKEHKQATRQRIIEAAGRRFKASGIDGSGVATLMSDAGLTNGAFYAHFASKDDLVAATVTQQLGDQTAAFEAMISGPGGLESLVRTYLSPRHRDNPDHGCPSAALLEEICRAGEEARTAYTDGLLASIDAIVARLAPDDPASARGRVLGVFATMVGALQLSRAIVDREISGQILEQGIQSALYALRLEPELID